MLIVSSPASNFRLLTLLSSLRLRSSSSLAANQQRRQQLSRTPVFLPLRLTNEAETLLKATGGNCLGFLKSSEMSSRDNGCHVHCNKACRRATGFAVGPDVAGN